MSSGRVSVYMPVHNYEKYVMKAVESVLSQTYKDWELLIINDGSTDQTGDIVQEYERENNIRVIHQHNQGLTVTNNIALRSISGDYVMRLDGDDYLDENALLVLVTTLQQKPGVGLVYPDYFETDEFGEITKLVRRKKIGIEDRAYDLPAHGACTMFRRDVLVQLGGYDETNRIQDGYEIWLKFMDQFKPYNVNIPLFYYRQHGKSITDNEQKLLDARRKIIRNHANQIKFDDLNILGVIPVDSSPVNKYASAMYPFCGEPLVAHSIKEALGSVNLSRVVVSTSDEEVQNYIREKKQVLVCPRPRELEITKPGIMVEILNHCSEYCFQTLQEQYDGYCLLPINTPLRTSSHIDWAVNVMKVYGSDEVLSVEEELSELYQHRMNGLETITKLGELRLEKDSLYRFNTAVRLISRHSLLGSDSLGKKIGHIIMLKEEGIRITDEYNHWLAAKIMSERR